MTQSKWFTSSKFKGVRWYKHHSRKHGVRFDRCYGIRYAYKGIRYEFVLGWESSDWSEHKAFLEREKFLANLRTGKGPVTPLEERELAAEERSKDILLKKQEDLLDISFLQFFEEVYFPIAKLDWKPESGRKHKEHVYNWIAPVTSGIPLRKLGLNHINSIKANLAKAGRAPRTMQYIFRTFAMVWNAARDNGIVAGSCPTKLRSFKLPKIDNNRERYLTPQEAKALLEAVYERSPQAHDMAQLSLYTGMRFGEVASLSWGCIDLAGGTVRILRAKHEKSRTIPMPELIRTYFKSLDQGRSHELVFPDENGRRMEQVPSSFKRAINDAELNKDIDDPKKRFGFHGLRHTYASWLVQAGVDLFRVQRLLGHSTPVMTDRYSHLAQEDLAIAVEKMERSLRQNKSGKLVSVNFRDQA